MAVAEWGILRQRLEEIHRDADSDSFCSFHRFTEMLTVQTLSGSVLAEVKAPLPRTVHALKTVIAAQCGMHAAWIVLLQGESVILGVPDLVKAYSSQTVTAIIDHSGAFLWDFIGNPDAAKLDVAGGFAVCLEMRRRLCINVVTQAPLPAGLHFVDFVVHCKGDEHELWSGVIHGEGLKLLEHGEQLSGFSKSFTGCFYYCACYARPGRLTGNPAFSDAELFASVRSGDTIGMAVDCDNRVVAFSCNGEVQGACKLPPGPLYLLTQFTGSGDHVELRRRDLEDVPLDLVQALCEQRSSLEPTKSWRHQHGQQGGQG
eukprot:TRINITY_DN88974_c0_g1_i1.p1 TRINITY_DN88974_c0_g1~~TRINITY_DN88974_c0_g1_i1.p1  ORF type:complete len:316 (+),score=51.99 TRINITY_DN88974_c0_g1_i1:31-978(+)